MRTAGSTFPACCRADSSEDEAAQEDTHSDNPLYDILISVRNLETESINASIAADYFATSG